MKRTWTRSLLLLASLLVVQVTSILLRATYPRFYALDTGEAGGWRLLVAERDHCPFYRSTDSRAVYLHRN